MALSASCIGACAVSRIFEQRLEMGVVLNATLSGAVAIGTPSDLITSPSTALAIGAFSGIVTALGYLKLS